MLGVPIRTSTPSHQFLNFDNSDDQLPFLLWEDLSLKAECQEYLGIKCIGGNDVCLYTYTFVELVVTSSLCPI